MQPGLGLSLQIVDMTKTIVRCEKKINSQLVRAVDHKLIMSEYSTD